MAKNPEVTIKTICNVDEVQSILAEVIDDNLAFVMTKEIWATKTDDPRFRLRVLWHLARLADLFGEEEAYKLGEAWRSDEDEDEEEEEEDK